VVRRPGPGIAGRPAPRRADDSEFFLDHLADDVAGLLAALGVERATFVGFSLGGMVGLALAMRHPGW
jgi:pimeloyl-ACP methyl ester carboxylesterase